jgi:hypothetical protein
MWNKAHHNNLKTYVFVSMPALAMFTSAPCLLTFLVNNLLANTQHINLVLFPMLQWAPVISIKALFDCTLVRFKHLGIAKQQRPQWSANYNCEPIVHCSFQVAI